MNFKKCNLGVKYIENLSTLGLCNSVESFSRNLILDKMSIVIWLIPHLFRSFTLVCYNLSVGIYYSWLVILHFLAQRERGMTIPARTIMCYLEWLSSVCVMHKYSAWRVRHYVTGHRRTGKFSKGGQTIQIARMAPKIARIDRFWRTKISRMQANSWNS